MAIPDSSVVPFGFCGEDGGKGFWVEGDTRHRGEARRETEGFGTKMGEEGGAEDRKIGDMKMGKGGGAGRRDVALAQRP